jgi:hypothetical protein
MGISVPAKECLEAEDAGGAGAANQHRPHAAFEQPDPPQDEGAHDKLAKLCRAHDKRPHVCGVERKGDAPVLTCHNTDEGRLAAQLMQLSGELAR